MQGSASAPAGADAPFTSVEQGKRFLRRIVESAYELDTHRRQSKRDLLALTASRVGGCMREAAYRLSGTEPTDLWRAFLSGRQATTGTWIHEGILPLIAEVLAEMGLDLGAAGHESAQIEVPIECRAGDDVIRGSADLIWGNVLIDLKTLHPAKVDSVLGHDRATWEHRIQVGVYALGREQSGHRVDWVVWLYSDRESGDDIPILEAWTPEYALEVLQRIWQIQHYKGRPDQAPQQGPLLRCQSCPWHLHCLGEPVEPVARTEPLPTYDDPRVEAALAAYAEARAKITELEHEKEFLRFIIERSAPGRYGPWQWEITEPRKKLVPDKEKAIQDLEAAGLPVPKRAASGSFSITAVRQPKPQTPPAVSAGRGPSTRPLTCDGSPDRGLNRTPPDT